VSHSRTLLGMVLVLFASMAQVPSQRIPNADLMLTIQQKEDGKLETGFHVLELRCVQRTMFAFVGIPQPVPHDRPGQSILSKGRVLHNPGRHT